MSTGVLMKLKSLLLENKEDYDCSDLVSIVTTNKSFIEEKLNEFEVVGLRIDSNTNYKVGDKTALSRVWDDGEVTDELLKGTSCIDVQPLLEGETFQGSYYGEHCYLIAGNYKTYGEDPLEIIIEDAVVIKDVTKENIKMSKVKSLLELLNVKEESSIKPSKDNTIRFETIHEFKRWYDKDENKTKHVFINIDGEIYTSPSKAYTSLKKEESKQNESIYKHTDYVVDIYDEDNISKVRAALDKEEIKDKVGRYNSELILDGSGITKGFIVSLIKKLGIPRDRFNVVKGEDLMKDESKQNEGKEIDKDLYIQITNKFRDNLLSNVNKYTKKLEIDGLDKDKVQKIFDFLYDGPLAETKKLFTMYK